jgi:protein required for attachment to host cells
MARIESKEQKDDTMIKTTYFLVADSNHATLYSKKNNEKKLKGIKVFECTDCKMQNRHLVSDTPGRSSQQTKRRTISHSPFLSPREKAIEIFAKELTDFLDEARKKNLYDELIIASSPSFMGVLQNKLDKNTSRTVKKSIGKNLTKDNESEILKRLSQ